jgi:hypothetical protein
VNESKERRLTLSLVLLLLLSGAEAKAQTCPNIYINSPDLMGWCPSTASGCTWSAGCNSTADMALGGGVQNGGDSGCLYITQSFPNTSYTWFVEVSAGNGSSNPQCTNQSFKPYVVCMSACSASTDAKQQVPKQMKPTIIPRSKGKSRTPAAKKAQTR